MLQHGAGLRSLLRLNDAPLCGKTTFCLSIRLLMDVSVVAVPARGSDLGKFDCIAASSAGSLGPPGSLGLPAAPTTSPPQN